MDLRKLHSRRDHDDDFSFDDDYSREGEPFVDDRLPSITVATHGYGWNAVVSSH